MSPRILAAILPGFVLLSAGTARPGGEAKPLVVPVSVPVARQVTDYGHFTGRTSAVSSVELRARVTGYLTKVAFKEGSEVRQGDVLFEIDPRPYQSELDQATASRAAADARLKRVAAEWQRAKTLFEKGVIAREDLDKLHAELAEAEAAQVSARARLEAAQLTLSFTRIQAPVGGVIGRALLDPGNLVRADDTAVAHIVSVDPMYVYFDMDEATLLRLRRATNDGKLKADALVPARLGLAGEDGYPHQGTINFIDNRVNPTTGTINVRGVFRNPRPAGGVPLMMPGLFARVRLPMSEPYDALLVSEPAVRAESRAGGEPAILYIIGADNKVEERRITMGPQQEDGLRVIANGLKADEQVLVGKLDAVRPGMVVRTERVPMPVKNLTQRRKDAK
jgi:multidrug efflux system membrane fusion protein